MAAEIDVAVWHDEVVMHVPPDVAERARKVAPDNGVDLLVPVGGGSTTGLAKAVSLTTGIPSIAVASTYVGSEATVFGPFFVEGDPRTEIGDSVFSVKESLIKKFVRHDSGTPTPGGWDVSTIGDGLSEIPADGVAQ